MEDSSCLNGEERRERGERNGTEFHSSFKRNAKAMSSVSDEAGVFDDSQFRDIEAPRHMWMESVEASYELVIEPDSFADAIVRFRTLGELLEYTCYTFIDNLNLTESEGIEMRMRVREVTFNGYDQTPPIVCSGTWFILRKCRFMKKIY